MAADSEQFAKLFKQPSVEAMHHDLTPRDFERFIGYVLKRAGYVVKEVGPHFLRGVDLEIRAFGKNKIVGGIECKKYGPDNPVSAQVVRGVKGAAAVDKPGAKPYVITTSGFNRAAYQMAESGTRKAYLVNGEQLVRYIKYIQGSRYEDDETAFSLSPEFFAGQDEPRPDSQCKILTIANNKGGVGKTTTAYYLGVELARRGNRVLLVDLDAQANLTEWCFNGMAPDRADDAERPYNIAQYFSGLHDLQRLITPAGKDRLCIIPSDPFLTLRDLGGSGRPDVESKFVDDIQNLSMQHIPHLGGIPDWIIIDTPPAMSVFTRAGLAASHYVLAPARPRKASLRGTQNMLNTLETMNALTNGRSRYLGIVLTHWDDLATSRRFEQVDLQRALPGSGGQVFKTRIPIDNQLEKLEPGSNTGGARAYVNLAEEVLRHVSAYERAAVEVRN